MLGAIGFGLVWYTALRVFDHFLMRHIDKVSRAEADKFKLTNIFSEEEIQRIFGESEQRDKKA